MSVPVFSNRASLSLAALDAMGNIVRKNEQTLQSVGAGGRMGVARTAPAWYVPTPVDGVGSAVGFTCISPGTIGAVDISRAYQIPLIINGKLHLPMAHIQLNREIDPEDNTVTYYPGAIDSIDVREGTPATLEHGTICLPLAESPTVETDDIAGVDFTSIDGWAGLLQGVEWSTSIDRPVITTGIMRLPLAQTRTFVGEWDGVTDISPVPGAIAGVEYVTSISEPRITNGVLQLPPGGAATLAWFGRDVGSPVAGTLRGGECAAITAIAAISGVLYFPLASCDKLASIGTSSCTVCSVDGTSIPYVPGAVCGAQIDAATTAPYIASGVLYFPDTGSGQLAEFEGTTSAVSGGLQAATISAVATISAHSGVLYFPLAEANDYPCSVATPGALAGAEIIASLTKPEICSGVLYFPPQGNLKGIRDIEGTYHTFEQMETYVGARVPVAYIALRTAANDYLTLKLFVGYEGGYLDFSFSTNSPA